MDEHTIEAMGKARVIIKNGKVIDVEEPMIEYCPLFHKHRGIEKLNKELIKQNMEFRIDDFGMCTSKRVIEMKDFLSFGISEIISTLLNENIIDCSIMVCEGCGTIIITEGEIAQGIGGRVSGLVSTSPMPEIIEKIGTENILNPENAAINQIEGVNLAIANGYEKIAVTIANPEDGKNIRDLERKYNENSKNKDNISIYIFGVHTTGVNKEEAEKLFDYCDVITSCASKPIRDLGEKKAIKKVGESIPIYAATEKGKEFLELRIEKIGGITPKKNAKSPEPLL